MKSKARRVVDKWIKQAQKDRLPTYIAEGFVFLYPARSVGGDHYPVVWLTRSLPSGKVVNEFLCGCKGWWYSEQDECYHVKDLKAKIKEGKAKIA